jgi:hypothetical protein
MMTEDDLDFVVSDQREVFISKPQGVLRHVDVELYLNTDHLSIE